MPQKPTPIFITIRGPQAHRDTAEDQRRSRRRHAGPETVPALFRKRQVSEQQCSKSLSFRNTSCDPIPQPFLDDFLRWSSAAPAILRGRPEIGAVASFSPDLSTPYIREYIGVHNEDPKPFVWTRTADQILDSIARYA